MQITSVEIARYRRALDQVAGAARNYVKALNEEFVKTYPKASVAEVREVAKGAVSDALNAFGDQAATLACDLFDEIMEAEGITAESTLYDTIDRGMLDDKLRYYARDLVEGNIPSFTSKVTDLTEFYVKRSAYDNMVRNCDANKVRYARVPSGRETCSFCFMLCSRGFVYHTQATAKGLHGMHAHCDCIVVPGVQGQTAIDGYDPDAMYERWAQCAKVCGSNKRKDIMREVETRDWRWLYSGAKCKVTKEQGANPLPKEVVLADILTNNGFDVEFIKEINKSHVKTADARLNGLPWEFKIPEKWNDKTVKNQFKRALGKGTDSVVLSGSVNGALLDDMNKEVRRLFSLGEFAEIRQVIVDDVSGYLRRIRRT